ncbi:hypothetical protein GCM10011571_35600 [Marinithermofilum abyssi]|uniref:Uncharacterized protein n=1 Tax=Marinithermofilum abyssi TaxID=1571185 RepID=A0A8J2VLN2_9BACL|nr:hypothetical protein [Marinithermofilum abyssi]GGE30255.1 hypothetical protein GCM10011571_35600 [Marinithermofilum abyssi]
MSPSYFKLVYTRWYAVARQLPYESHILEIPEFPQLESQLRVPQSGPLVETAKKQREMTMAVLAEHVKEPTDFRVFIGFKVPRVSRMAIKRRIRRTIYHKWYDLRRYIGTISGLRPYDILEEELFDYQDAEELIAQELSSLLVNKPATTGSCSGSTVLPCFAGSESRRCWKSGNPKSKPSPWRETTKRYALIPT